MQIRHDAMVHVFSKPDGTVSRMRVAEFLNAVKGGSVLDEDVEVYTEEGEARAAARAEKRRRQMRRFSRDEMLAASKLVLLDSEGGVIREIAFCPTD
jgi:hypothetical protein